jgi:hypothetical protein
MGINFHVGLPGPFSYNKRVTGGKKSEGKGIIDALMLIGIVIIALLYVVYWICVMTGRLSIWAYKSVKDRYDKRYRNGVVD